MASNLEGQTAIVTGSSSGIGRAIARRLAKEGANIVTNARSKERADATARELEEYGDAIGVEADVSDYEQVESLVDAAVNEFGQITIMVNNAAIQRRGNTEDMPLEKWHRVIDVNLNGVYYGSRVAGSEMIASGTGGSIVNVSSIMGELGQTNPGRTPYNTAKGAVNNLTRCLAVEWAEHDISVNVLSPGYIKTENTEESLLNAPFNEDNVVDRTPLGRWGSPEEMATCVSFLASGDHFVTGEILHADGGWMALG